jgi:hypothetical protein
MSSREQPMLYTLQQQHLPILSDDDDNQVPLLTAEHSWSLHHTYLHVKFCCTDFTCDTYKSCQLQAQVQGIKYLRSF